MKRILALLLATIMLLSLVSCNKCTKEDDINSKIKTEIEIKAMTQCTLRYDCRVTSSTCTNIKDNGDGTYNVYGYVIAIDNYGDKYRGNFDAEVTVESGDVSITEFNLETPTRQK